MIKKTHKTVKISDLKEYKNNNKIHGDNIQEIIKSIKANTYISNIIVDENFVILAGHGRKKALEAMEIEKEEVTIIEGLTSKQKKDFRIRDNRLTELSQRDHEALEIELNELDDPDLNELFSYLKNKEDVEFKNKEIDPEDLFDGDTCICPKCHFEFSPETK